MSQEGDGWHMVLTLIGILLSSAFGLWAWVVKTFGERHLNSMDEIIKRLDQQGERIAKLEGRRK
jgi:hypothetical protein